MQGKTLSIMKALEIMRTLSRDNVPFSITYCTLDESKKKSTGKKIETNVILKTGYRRNQSDKSDLLVSYLRTDTNERRQFYAPLLLEFNGIKIKI